MDGKYRIVGGLFIRVTKEGRMVSEEREGHWEEEGGSVKTLVVREGTILEKSAQKRLLDFA